MQAGDTGFVPECGPDPPQVGQLVGLNAVELICHLWSSRTALAPRLF